MSEKKEIIFSKSFIKFITENKSKEYLSAMIKGFKKLCKDLDNPEEESYRKENILKLASFVSTSDEDTLDENKIIKKTADFNSYLKENFPQQFHVARSEFFFKENKTEKINASIKSLMLSDRPLKSNISKRTKKNLKKTEDQKKKHKKREEEQKDEPDENKTYYPVQPSPEKEDIFKDPLLLEELFGVPHKFEDHNQINEYIEWWNFEQRTEEEINNSAELQEIANKFLN